MVGGFDDPAELLADGYGKAATKVTIVKGQVVVNATNAGPVPVMLNDLTQMARSGALDQALIEGQRVLHD